MKPLFLTLFGGAVLSVVTWIQPKPAISATLLYAEKAAEIVTVRNVTVKDNVVSGELLNKSRRSLRDVQLLIRYAWQWNNEFRPKDDSPGDAVFYTVEKEIPPGGTVPFTYKPSSSLASRPDGNFVTTVSVAGFTEIIR
ncbi:MAG: hypothetical protein ACREQA_11180 [Candidatus Binatia bacterium]